MITKPPPHDDAVIVKPEKNQLGAWLMTLPWLEWLADLARAVDMTPTCHVYRGAVQSIADSTETDVLWTAEDHDNASMHDTSTNTDRITIPEDGMYVFGAHLIWDADAVGVRYAAITLNDPAAAAASAVLVQDNLLAASFAGNKGRNVVSDTRNLSAGDVLRLQSYQTSGGPLDILGTTANGPSANGFWCFKVSK